MDSRIKALKELFSDMAKLMGFDFSEEALAENKSHNFFTYGTKKTMFKALNYINTGSYGFAVTLLNETVKDLLVNYKILDYQHVSTKERYDDLLKSLSIMNNVATRYKLWLDNEYNEYLQSYASEKKTIFKEGDITTDNIPPEVFINLDNLFLEHENLIKIFKHRIGTQPIGEDFLQYRLHENIIISDSLHEWLEFSKQSDEDVTTIIPFLKIEKIVDYSYFLFLVKYKDHTFIVSDYNDFGNPRNKESSRNPRRKRESVYSNIDLPYGLIDDIEKLRASNKLPKNPKLNLELYYYPIVDLAAYNKMYMLELLSTILKNIKAEYSALGIIGTAQAHVDQKLLTSSKIETEVKEGDFEYWEEQHNKRLQEILDMIEYKDRTSTALVKTDLSVVTSSEYFDKDFLCTPDSFDNLVKWNGMEKKKDEIKNKIKETFGDAYSFGGSTVERDLRYEALKNLGVLFETNMERVYGKIFIAPEVNLERSGFADWSTKPKSRIGELVIFKNKLHTGMSNINLFNGEIWSYSKTICNCCNKHHASVTVSIEIKTYLDIIFLLGLKDKYELPQYFRAFRTHSYLPYDGNSILDNTNPLAQLRDPCSRGYTNGLEINILLCKTCYKKLNKQYNAYSYPVVLVPNPDGNYAVLPLGDEKIKNEGIIC